MLLQMESILKVRSALIAFGSNQSVKSLPPAAVLARALAALHGDVTRLGAVSRFYRTPAFPAESGPEFVNGAARLETHLPADGLLSRLHAIEADFGRSRDIRWGPRTLDLDLIALEEVIVPDPATVQGWIDLPPADQAVATPDRLLLPHPRLQDRAFVLIPLADIAVSWRHPLTGRTVSDMLAALPEAEKAEIRPF